MTVTSHFTLDLPWKITEDGLEYRKISFGVEYHGMDDFIIISCTHEGEEIEWDDIPEAAQSLMEDHASEMAGEEIACAAQDRAELYHQER